MHWSACSRYSRGDNTIGSNQATTVSTGRYLRQSATIIGAGLAVSLATFGVAGSVVAAS